LFAAAFFKRRRGLRTGELGKALHEQKAKIILDIANKKRNTPWCFEVGYVSGSLLIVGGYCYSSAPRFTNYSRTLS
jgi:hypothetical protein